MPRAKPFSGKQKKAQLQEKRAKKAGLGGDDESGRSDPKGRESSAAEGHVPDELLTSSLGKSGKANRFSTVFARERDDAVMQRRVASDLPLDTSKRGSPLVARLPPPHDPVLDHPKGVLLRRGMTEGDRRVYLSAESRALEEGAFTAWLDAIYAKYPREGLNHFEHSMEVWAQLWHTLASADVIALVADVRNPLWHIPHSLVAQVTHELRKPLVTVLNKTDLVPSSHVAAWSDYLRRLYPERTAIVPFSSSGLDLGPITSLGARRKAMRDARRAHDPALVAARKTCARALLLAAGVPDEAIEAVMAGMDASAAVASTSRRERIIAAGAAGRVAAGGAGVGAGAGGKGRTGAGGRGGHLPDVAEEEDDEDGSDAEDDDSADEEHDDAEEQGDDEAGTRSEESAEGDEDDDEDEDDAAGADVAAAGSGRGPGSASLASGATRARDPALAQSDKSARRRERKLKKAAKAGGGGAGGRGDRVGAATGGAAAEDGASHAAGDGDSGEEADASSGAAAKHAAGTAAKGGRAKGKGATAGGRGKRGGDGGGRGRHEAAGAAAGGAGGAAPAPLAQPYAAPVAAAAWGSLTIGMVGHPNAGKSSVINCIAGEKRVSVSRTAGHTKRAQTVPLAPGLALLDCPGLVFPHALSSIYSLPPSVAAAAAAASADATAAGAAAAAPAPAAAPVVVGAASRAEVIAARAASASGASTGGAGGSSAGTAGRGRSTYGAAPTVTLDDEEVEQRAIQELLGVIPVAQVREPYTAVRYLAQALPLERMYGLALPKDEDAWTPLALCEALATKRGIHIARTGRPDGHAAGREVIYDSQDGVLPIAWLPPAELPAAPLAPPPPPPPAPAASLGAPFVC